MDTTKVELMTCAELLARAALMTVEEEGLPVDGVAVYVCRGGEFAVSTNIDPADLAEIGQAVASVRAPSENN